MAGAARTGTSSARGSGRTPSTRRPSTSSRPGPKPRTGQAIWASVSRPGTRGRSRCRPPPTGRRFPIRSPRPTRIGAGRRATAACTAGTDPHSAAEARRPRSSRRRPRSLVSGSILRYHSPKGTLSARAQVLPARPSLGTNDDGDGFRFRRGSRRAAGRGDPPARSRTGRRAGAWPAPPRSTASRRRRAVR